MTYIQAAQEIAVMFVLVFGTGIAVGIPLVVYLAWRAANAPATGPSTRRHGPR